MEVQLEPGHILQLPEGVEERAIHVVNGRLKIKVSIIAAHSMAVFSPADGIEITAATTAHFVIIGGEHPSRRHIWWNFVSNRSERIEQAKTEWRKGRLPKVPGDEEEFIPLPVDS